ncbi:Nramp family divalent metal transporter [Kozakia baliensis]|uniref:Nramp family divalent metal transporter n=1 Tax=Kozakia baliensis TaxID=153496 RepID=UPI00068FAC4A|nr:Nramp family divalent metal transporter [Kozakia baliensis]
MIPPSSRQDFDALAHAALHQGPRSPRALLVFLGPALVASIAYVDPGNFATNIQAGASYGNTLVWVVIMANLMAMLYQTLSARLGIVTGRNLAELCRLHFPPKLVWCMWVASELASMATDLAEFLGAALGLTLLFGIPMFLSMIVAGVITYAILELERSGFRHLEQLIALLVAVISICYLLELLIAPPDWVDVGRHLIVPRIPNAHALMLCIGIIGATIMPHAIYLHSGLTQRRIVPRDAFERRRLLNFSTIETIAALSLAGMVNMAMLVMAATVFHHGYSGINEIEEAWRTLIPLLGKAAASLFLIALIASGISSSVVGTMAGQIVMQGFIKRHIPIWVRRVVTMAPAFVIIGLGYGAGPSLVMSQVALSLTLPVPMLALIWLSHDPKIMGAFRLHGTWLVVACIGAAIVLLLNFLLVAQSVGISIPGLPSE